MMQVSTFNSDQSQEALKPVVPNIALEQIIERVGEMSTLPHIAFRLIKICQNPKTDPKDLCDVLAVDPVLSARVLRCVNSSAYGMTKPVTDLHRAVCLLGYSQLCDLAMTASVSSVFEQDEICGKYVRANLWRHMMSVGICARMIAVRCQLADFESVYLAGLLHDIGIILIDQYEHEAFADMMIHFTPEPGGELVSVEQSKFGYDHTMLGVRIACKWGLDQSLQDVIRYHHQVNQYLGEHSQMLACVDLANLICTVRGLSSIGHQLVTGNPWSMHQLGLTAVDVEIINDDFDAELEQYRELIRIGTPHK